MPPIITHIQTPLQLIG